MNQPSMRYDEDEIMVPSVPQLPRPRVADDTAILPRDSHVVKAPEVLRLSAQNAVVLARLQQGPASARELSAIALGYRQRVHDIRCAGYTVNVKHSIYSLGEAE